MEENLHKDNLEEFFKNAVNRAGDDPAADGWDVPSDQVWENINTAVNPPASPSSPFNWKWLGALLLGAILLGVLYYNYSLNRKIDHLTQAVEENQTQIEDLQTKDNVPATDENGLSSNTVQDDGTQITVNAEGQQEKDNQKLGITAENFDQVTRTQDSENLNGGKKTNEFSLVHKPEEDATKGQTTSEEVENNINQNNQTTLTEQALQPQADQQKNDVAAKEANDLDLNAGDVSRTEELAEDPKKSDDRKEKEESVVSDFPDNMASDDPENVETMVDSTSTTQPPVLKSDSTTIRPEIAETTSKEKRKDAKSEDQETITPDVQAIQKKTTDEVTEISDQKTIAEDSLDLAETAQNLPLEKLPAETGFEKGFYLGAHLAPTYTYRDIQLTGNNPILRRLLDKQEKGDYSYSFGVKAGYNFSKNWSIETGVNYSKATILSRHRKQIQYRQEIETPAADGFDSQYNLTLNTSYGDINTDIAITRASDISIPQNDFIGLRIDTRQDLSFIRIPLVIKYRTAGEKKLHFSAKAGIMNSFIVQRDVEIRAVQLDRSGLVLRRRMVEKQFNGLEKSSVDLLFGIGIEYDLSKNLGMYLEPTITHSISPVYERGPIKTYPIITTLDIGLSYKF